VALVVLVATLACAVSEPPSGGPEDRAPPAVASTQPAPDSTGVDPSSAIAITFTEDMARARVERLVTVQPSITIDRVEWQDRTLIIRPSGGLARDTTYVVRVKPGYRDRHGVTATGTREFAFATGASLDTASIAGTVRFRREPVPKGVVRCFRVPGPEALDPTASRPDREAHTRPDGGYRLRYLPGNDARFVVMAFVDANGNGSFERASESFLVRADTVVLTPAVPVATNVNMDIVDPKEPGVVRGNVVNETGIENVPVSVALFEGADTTRARHFGVCDDVGSFELGNVLRGSYLLRAFLDLRADSVCGDYPCPDATQALCLEPCVALADTVRVEPGQTVQVGTLVLRRRQGP
jgi:hypothetical protein